MNYTTSRVAIRREETASKALGIQISRRRYLIVKELLDHPRSSIWSAIETVSQLAQEHPDWDMSETKTWDWWHRFPSGTEDVNAVVTALFR